MKFSSKAFKRSVVALGFGVFVLLGTGATANAQSHHQSNERRDLAQHQWQERAYYGNSHAVRDHQYQERYRERRHEQIERYSNGYGRYGYGGYANNGTGYYGSRGYYNNNGYYGNNGYYNGGNYSNYGGYYGHRDSRNPVKRFFHHALGGH